MRIQIICTSSPVSVYGSRVTAVRWSNMFRAMGHSVEVAQHYGGTICDLMIALDAYQCADAILQFHRRHPEKPSVLALTGTDIYRDVPNSPKAQEAMEVADRLVIFQPLAMEVLPEHLKKKTRLIYQSAEQTPDPAPVDRNAFVVAVVGHLRPDKDPLRVAEASRLLPESSRIRVIQAGDAEDGDLVYRARQEGLRNRRYRYLGSIPRWKVRQLMAGSDLVVLSSRIEGGANVISEAVVDYVPLLATRIPGNVGLLGEDYPGYFEPGDTEGLAELLYRAETDRDFYQALKTHCALLARQFRPEKEVKAWEKLIKELSRPRRYAGGRARPAPAGPTNSNRPSASSL